MSRQDIQTLLREVEDLMLGDRDAELRELIGRMHPSQIADLLEAMPAHHIDLWALLGGTHQGKVLMHIESDDMRRDLIRHIDADELLAALNKLSPDEQADLIGDVPELQAHRALSALEKQNQELLKQVLVYDKDTAGGIMHPDTITVRDNITLGEAAEELRKLKSVPPRLDRLFVVDECSRYKGILRIFELVRNPTDTPVATVMEDAAATIHHHMSVGEVARLFDDFEILRAPVVDDDDTLLGHIVADDVIDVMRREARTIENSAARLPRNESLFSPVIASTKRRGVWLGVNLLAAFLASFMLNLFEGTLEKIIALAILLPVVMSMGGIAGSQTLTLVVRGVATGQFGQSNFKRLLTKEIFVGLLSGVLWAACIGVLAGLWFTSVGIGLIIAGAVIVNLSCATAAGAIIPYTMKRAGIDPALSGGVLLTTLTDIIGIVVFLGLGTIFLL